MTIATLPNLQLRSREHEELVFRLLLGTGSAPWRKVPADASECLQAHTY